MGVWVYLQLHDEVQVVGALVDVLQSYDILMLYPGEQEQKRCVCVCVIKEVKLAVLFCQNDAPSTDNKTRLACVCLCAHVYVEPT